MFGNRIFEKIIDPHNLLDIHFLIGGVWVTRSIGRAVLPDPVGNGMGTGFIGSSES